MNCLACLTDLAKPFRTITVCNLLSKKFVAFNPKTSSIVESFVKIPNLTNLVNN